MAPTLPLAPASPRQRQGDRKSTRLNSSHANISYAVFCLKKKHRDHMADEMRTICQHVEAHAAAAASSCAWRSSPDLIGKAAATLTEKFAGSPFFLMIRRPPRSTPFPSTTLFR